MQLEEYSRSNAVDSSPLSPYPNSLPPSVPQLPVFNQGAWYARRDQPLPPEIGFRLDVLTALSDDAATAPYPEKNELASSINSPSYPSEPNGNPSGTIHSYKSDDDTDSQSSDIDCTESSVFYEESQRPEYPKRIVTSPEGADEAGDLVFFSENVIKEKESRPLPPLRGSRAQFIRHGLPYPKEAFAEIERKPCDHSGGDHIARH